MNSLLPSDLRKIVEFLQLLYRATNIREFPSYLVSIIPLIVKNDFTAIISISAELLTTCQGQHNTPPIEHNSPVLLTTSDFQLSSKIKADMPSFLQNPLAERYLLTGDDSAQKMSDFRTNSQSREQEIWYQHYLQPLGMSDQISLVVADSKLNTRQFLESDSSAANNVIMASSITAEQKSSNLFINIYRDKQDFDEHDRAKLNLLSPHILQAYQNSQLLSNIKEDCTQICQALDQATIIIIRRNGLVRFITESSLDLINRYFPLYSFKQHSLPEIIASWAKKKISEISKIPNSPLLIPPLRIIQNKKILIVKLSIDAPRDQYLLTLEEQVPLKLSLSALENFKLSNREIEVLCWIIRGSDTRHISKVLSISDRTVEKHCENIYEKLGVNNRFTAINQVLQELGIIMPR
jgi:DNA-binding CsgD family transcriptional regulator